MIMVNRAIFSLLMCGSLLWSCNEDGGKSFEGGKNESKPAAKPTDSSDLKNGDSEKTASKILGFEGRVTIALKSGLVLCKEGKVSLDILSNFTFEMNGVDNLKCASAKINMDEVLPPLINMVAKSMGRSKIETDGNVIITDSLPSFKGMKFSPKAPLFYMPTIGEDSIKAKGFKKVYDTQANFLENSMGVSKVNGKSTVQVVDVNKVYTAPDGKKFDKTVHWMITHEWEEQALVPFFRVMDVTWSTAPIDLLNLGIEIVINPKNVPLYAVALQSELLKSIEALAGLVDLDTDVGLVINITR